MDNNIMFDGATYDHDLDGERLSSQLLKVFNAMSDQKWHTVPQLAEIVKGPEPSISAQIRNLRKEKHGGYLIERRRVDNYYEFRLVLDSLND